MFFQDDSKTTITPDSHWSQARPPPPMGVWSYCGFRIILKNTPCKAAACSGVQKQTRVPAFTSPQGCSLVFHTQLIQRAPLREFRGELFSPSAVTGTQELVAAPAHEDLAPSNALGALSLCSGTATARKPCFARLQGRELSCASRSFALSTEK